ncbi:MAG: CaiB/BaiF CoA-transferase family protein [Actinomycetota bacterium]|nr:CaiB/BaiF CoA-transferase family protein [Actinomycetota bacterium]
MVTTSDTDEDSASGPLSGVRVLAVEQMQSLPFATQLLARLGAEVVKVEHPIRGDLGRSSLPAVNDVSGNQIGATFIRNNLSKKSIGIDLKHDLGQKVFKQLLPKFDIVAENFKAGTMESFGLDYLSLQSLDKSIIYLSISGFGHDSNSPYTDWPAFAPIAEAMSGLYTFNRPPEEELKVSPAGALGDTGTGLFAVIAILAALRYRETTGKGQYIDLSMLDSMVAFADIVPNYFSMGHDPRTPSSLINHGFKIMKGEIVIQIGREHQFIQFAELLGEEEWLDDPRFASRDGWVQNIDVLRETVHQWAGDNEPIEVCSLLADAGIAAAPVFTAEDIVNDPHIKSRNMLVEIATDSGEAALAAGNPIKMAGVREGTDTPPPSLGEHTNEILASELRMPLDEIEGLRKEGVIR